MAWADCPTCNPRVYWSMVSNQGAGALLADPWVVNAQGIERARLMAAAARKCLFDWAEDHYPSDLQPARAPSLSYPPYEYRYYAQTGAYVGVSSEDGHAYYMGPLTHQALADLGAAAGWQATAGCN